MLPGRKQEENGGNQGVNCIRETELAKGAGERAEPRERRQREEKMKNAPRMSIFLPPSRVFLTHLRKEGLCPI